MAALDTTPQATRLWTGPYTLLWLGRVASLLGDGVYVVALAWQVYAISDAPTALGVVGAAWTLPQVLVLLGAGVVVDRRDRRAVLIASDLVRAASVGALAVLALSGALRFSYIVALVAVTGGRRLSSSPRSVP